MGDQIRTHARWAIGVAIALVLLIAAGLVLLFVGPGKQATGPVPTPTPTIVVVSPTSSATSTPSATATASVTPTPTASARPTAAPSTSPTAKPTPTGTPRPSPTPPPTQPPANCVNIATWSVAQRLNQLIMVSGDFSNIAASGPYARAGVGAIVFFGQPAAGSGPAIATGLAGLFNDARATGQVLPWMSTDEEGGNVARLANVIGTLPTGWRKTGVPPTSSR